MKNKKLKSLSMMKVNVRVLLSIIQQARTSIEKKEYNSAEYHLISLENAIRCKMKAKASQ